MSSPCWSRDDPGYVKRARCLFELYTAIRLPRDVEVDLILSPLQANAFHDAVVAGGRVTTHSCNFGP